MNVTEKICRELKKRLETGLYAPGSRFPSESTLAEEFGVNKMTMNKIVSLLADQHYLIRGIRGAGTRVADNSCRPRGIIAFLSPLAPYSICILRGVYAEALRHNFAVITESPAAEDLQHRLSMLQRMGVAGIISATYGVPLLPEGMALSCVDSEVRPVLPGQKAVFINSDNFQGGIQMMEEIFRRGHREIVVFSAERFHRNRTAPKTPRVCGFHEVMERRGINDFEERTFYSAPDSLADAKYFLESFLKKFPGTTLIAADSDGAAALVSTAARQLKIKCPGDIALTGFGNVTQLPIASVNQNPERQGELAARYLIEHAASGIWSAPECFSVETSLEKVEQIPILVGGK